LAPGCDFIIAELIEIPLKRVTSEVPQKKTENIEEKIRIIKLKMVAKIG